MLQEFSDSILYFMNRNFNEAFNKLLSNGIHSNEEIDLLSYICYSSGRFADFINIYNKLYSKNICKSMHANKHIKILDKQNFIFTNINEIINQSSEKPDGSYPESNTCKKIMEMKKDYMVQQIEDLQNLCISHVKNFENATSFTFPFSCDSPTKKGPNNKHIKIFIFNHKNYAEDFFTLAEIFFYQKKFDLAFKYYQLSILFEPNKAIYYAYCAQAIYLSKSLSKSKSHMIYGDWLCDRAIRLNSKNPRWYFIRVNHLINFSQNFEPSSIIRSYTNIKKAKDLCSENKSLEKQINIAYDTLYKIINKNNSTLNNKLIKFTKSKYIKHFSGKNKILRSIRIKFEKAIAILIIGVILFSIGVFFANYSPNTKYKNLSNNWFNNFNIKTDNSNKAFKRYIPTISSAFKIAEQFSIKANEYSKKRYSNEFNNGEFSSNIESILIALEYNKDYLKELSPKGLPKTFKKDYNDFLKLYDDFLETSKNVFIFKENIDSQYITSIKIESIKIEELAKINNLANSLYYYYYSIIKKYT